MKETMVDIAELTSIRERIFLLQEQSFELAIQDAIDRGQTYFEVDHQYYH